MNKIKIRSTALRNVLLSKARALFDYYDGKHENVSENIQTGLVAHALFLEEDKIDQRYAFYNGIRGGSDYTRAVETGLEPVKRRVYDKAVLMVDALNDFLSKNVGILDIDNNTKFEVSLEHHDDYFVHTIKPDILGENFFVDYKTTALIYPELSAWVDHCIEMKTFVQLGYYYKILNYLGYKIDYAYHLVQSTVDPFCCSIFRFDKETMEAMQEEVDNAIHSFYRTIVNNTLGGRGLEITKDHLVPKEKYYRNYDNYSDNYDYID